MQSDFTIKPVGTSAMQPVRQLTPLELKPFEKSENTSVKIPLPADEKNGDGAEKKNVEQLQNFFDANGMTLKFSQDDETNQVIVELIDQKTGEAVRQIPSDISLKLAAEFTKLQGQFFSKKV